MSLLSSRSMKKTWIYIVWYFIRVLWSFVIKIDLVIKLVVDIENSSYSIMANICSLTIVTWFYDFKKMIDRPYCGCSNKLKWRNESYTLVFPTCIPVVVVVWCYTLVFMKVFYYITTLLLSIVWSIIFNDVSDHI